MLYDGSHTVRWCRCLSAAIDSPFLGGGALAAVAGLGTGRRVARRAGRRLRAWPTCRGSRAGLSAYPALGLIRLSVAETARLTRLARQVAAGLVSRTRLASGLRWSAWRRRHQAAVRWS